MKFIRAGIIGVALHIAHDEWRVMARNRVALVAGVLLAALVVTSALTSYQQWRATQAMQLNYQTRNAHEFEEQPDRHPHRMAHFGQYAFRAPGPLSFFDFGIDGFTGSVVYLEAHRQNSANFSTARQSSSLLRFGQLTPAFVLQTVSPLLIIFLAFACVSRERESGTLRLLLAQGVGGRTQIVGKIIGHTSIALLFAAPGLLAPIVMSATVGVGLTPALLMLGGYTLYLLVWVIAAVFISALVSRSRDALLVLLALWMALVILVPRIASPLASASLPLPTRFESDIAIHRELKAIGDSHNPDDPYFAAYKAKVLKQYGVARQEDLPVDFGGLVGGEGERLTSELFANHTARIAAIEDRQNRIVSAFGVISPVIALRQLSMALAGTDLASHRHFLLAVEAHRYAFVQGLNRLQVELVREKGQRISHEHWRELPRFNYQTPDPLTLDNVSVRNSICVLVVWLIALLVPVFWIGCRIERAVR